MNNNNNDNIIDNSILFFKIWRNLFLKTQLFKFISIYKSSEILSFSTLNQLRLCKDKEFCQKIQYHGIQDLEPGDLPKNGVLKIFEAYQLDLYKLLLLPPPGGEIINNNNNESNELDNNNNNNNNDGDNNNDNEKSIIPFGLEEILFRVFYNQRLVDKKYYPLLLSKLPNSITSVTFNCLFEKNPLYLDYESVPKNIKYLNVSYLNMDENSCVKFKSITEEITNGITCIEFPQIWSNGGITLKHGILPNSLIKLSMPGYRFRLSPGIIPSSVTDLEIGIPLNYVLQPNVIPPSVCKLKFTSSNSTELGIILTDNGALPNSLTELIINSYRPVIEPYSIPNSVTSLSITKELKPGCFINKKILPSSLKSLSVISENNYIIEKNSLPDRLTNLSYTINSSRRFNEEDFNNFNIFNSLPYSLTNLNLNINLQSQPLKFNSNYKYLKTLVFSGSGYNEALSCLPPNLTYLEFSSSFNQPIEIGSLSCLFRLQCLKFGFNFNQPIFPNVLPPFLYELRFGSKWNHPIIPNSLPNSLRKLYFDKYGSFSHSVDKLETFPPNLTILHFGNHGYDFPITQPNVLPNSLLTLVWCQDLDSQDLITKDVIPSSVKYLKIIH